MTRTEFDQLPMLLRREDVIRALGVNRGTLKQIQRSNPGLTAVVPGLRQLRYRKLVLAKIITVCD